MGSHPTNLAGGSADYIIVRSGLSFCPISTFSKILQALLEDRGNVAKESTDLSEKEAGAQVPDGIHPLAEESYRAATLLPVEQWEGATFGQWGQHLPALDLTQCAGSRATSTSPHT